MLEKDRSMEILGENAQLALDTLLMKPTKGIPQWMLLIMQVSEIEYFAGHKPGEYKNDPENVYLDLQHNIGTCFIDQFIPRNPLTMGDKGYEEGSVRIATMGTDTIILNGITIDSPESVIDHMEQYVFPRLKRSINGLVSGDNISDTLNKQEEIIAKDFGFSPDIGCDLNDKSAVFTIIEQEKKTQSTFGPDILKVPWLFSFPILRYDQYGYINYFMAYALYPEVMERDFTLQADLAVKQNTIIAQAIREGELPPVVRLDFDLADSRSTLVDINSLDRIWFPHFERSIQPFLNMGIRPIWHCDGNLMEMVPRLLEVGIGGFQGFQCEHGMDYEKICRMTDRSGNPLMIWGGVSVTKTLPYGTPEDVCNELRWLVDNGPSVGLCLGASSSITPGVKRQNLKALIEGLEYYRKNGRD